MRLDDQGAPIWSLTFKSAIADDDGRYPFIRKEVSADTAALADVIGLGIALDAGDIEYVEAEETYHTDDACPLCAPVTVLSIRTSITNLVHMREEMRKADMQPRIRPRVGLAARELEIARLDGGIDALNKLLTGFGLPPSPTSTT